MNGKSPLPLEAVCIVAEIGTGHNKNPHRAKDLIQAALDSGADIVKFQHFYAEEIIHPCTGVVDLPGGSVDLFQRFQELESSLNFLAFLKTSCENLGGRFLCSPFGRQSADELLAVGERNFKIASPELNHLPLLEFLAPRAEHLILSTGVSLLRDIEEALDTIRAANKAVRNKQPTPFVLPSPAPNITLLHCITAYPAPVSEYNLLLIPHLSKILGIPVGISDHSLDPIFLPSLSVFLGSVMIEKHFTLSKDDGGLDDPIALNPAEFASMVKAVREAESLLPEQLPTPLSASPIGENISLIKLLELVGQHSQLKDYTENSVSEAIGNGCKQLAATEKPNYGRSNRSIHILEDRPVGHVLDVADIAILRTEKNLSPGLHPRYFRQLIGHSLARAMTAGQGIEWIDIYDQARYRHR